MTEETDPKGLDAHSPGAKLDAGKPTFAMSLGYFRTALSAVNEISIHGALKYTKAGWRHVENAEERYREALIRHVAAACDDEDYDADSKLLHAAHAAWNALAWLSFVLLRLPVKQRSL